jgi:branched-chain amino acid transport system permease protein
MWVQLILQSLVNGVSLGALYVLMASGFTMAFGVMKVVNFAHGEFYMLGALLSYVLMTDMGIHYVFVLIIAPLIVAAVGFVVEKTLFQPILRNLFDCMILSLGLSLLLQQSANIFFGSEALFFPSLIRGTIPLFDLVLPADRAVVILASGMILTAYLLFLKFSKLGNAIRAVSQDPETARVQGVPVNRTMAVGFSVSVFLAAIAGVVIGPVLTVSATMGGAAILKAFIVVILGGLGRIGGAIFMGILVGMSESLVSTFIGGEYSDIFLFTVILCVLWIKRPSLFETNL